MIGIKMFVIGCSVIEVVTVYVCTTISDTNIATTYAPAETPVKALENAIAGRLK